MESHPGATPVGWHGGRQGGGGAPVGGGDPAPDPMLGVSRTAHAIRAMGRGGCGG